MHIILKTFVLIENIYCNMKSKETELYKQRICEFEAENIKLHEQIQLKSTVVTRSHGTHCSPYSVAMRQVYYDFLRKTVSV